MQASDPAIDILYPAIGIDVGIIRPLVAEAQLLGHCRQRGNLGRRRRGIQTVRKDGVWFHAMRIPAVDGRSVVSATGSIRSEEHTSELQSLMRISYAVFCLKIIQNHR